MNNEDIVTKLLALHRNIHLHHYSVGNGGDRTRGFELGDLHSSTLEHWTAWTGDEV
jgi:hypothetical protein